ncbi:unnamed protein product, partial [Nesidiocoris tenuis]
LGLTILDVGFAQARHPLNTTFHYFEIQIVDPGENCYIAIGLTQKVSKSFGSAVSLTSRLIMSLSLGSTNTLPEAVNPIPNNAKHILHCIPETDPHCKPDSISFDGGLKIPYQDIRNMFELISQQPENIKLIVPGGISGPLANYFQKVDRSRHEQAAKYGVCVFPNGLLVPIKPMLRILQLHFWLLQSSNDANTRDGNALHRSITWSNMECVLEILRCLIKANIVFVRMPGNEVLPYTQFVSNERVIPHEVLRHCIAEILGVSVPYLQFTNALLQLQQIASIRSQTPSNVHGKLANNFEKVGIIELKRSTLIVYCNKFEVLTSSEETLQWPGHYRLPVVLSTFFINRIGQQDINIAIDKLLRNETIIVVFQISFQKCSNE